MRSLITLMMQLILCSNLPVSLIPSSLGIETLLSEDFSEGLELNWRLFGDPTPMLCDTMGLPPPSFDNNGDELYNNGAVSRKKWDCSEGLTLECDMFVTSNERGAWISGMLGFDYSSDDQGIEGANPADIYLAYSYCGEADWATPHMQGRLNAVFTNPDGSKDNEYYIHLNDFLDSWHRFRIVIESDMTVSFYVDSILFHSTELSLPPEACSLNVVLGLRSNEWGRVFHDNLILLKP
ncbi:MAG: hypothetical protein JXR55_07795 [Candidatus Fermentibacteraceae bacterium]|nr:hypothetical protein [Candidatus Fermentibacteraceae bacterium]